LISPVREGGEREHFSGSYTEERKGRDRITLIFFATGKEKKFRINEERGAEKEKKEKSE